MNLPIKGVVVGNATTGKTCMVVSYISNTSIDTDGYQDVPSMFNKHSVNMIFKDDTINFELWDIGGQEDFDRIRKLFYTKTDVFFVTFSLDNEFSFQNVSRKWVPELRHHAPRVPIILVGTKLDLRDDKQYLLKHPEAVSISTVQGEELKELIGAVVYIECSAKTQENLKDVFDVAVKVVLEQPKMSKSQKGCSIL